MPTFYCRHCGEPVHNRTGFCLPCDVAEVTMGNGVSTLHTLDLTDIDNGVACTRINAVYLIKQRPLPWEGYKHWAEHITKVGDFELPKHGPNRLQDIRVVYGGEAYPQLHLQWQVPKETTIALYQGPLFPV